MPIHQIKTTVPLNTQKLLNMYFKISNITNSSISSLLRFPQNKVARRSQLYYLTHRPVLTVLVWHGTIFCCFAVSDRGKSPIRVILFSTGQWPLYYCLARNYLTAYDRWDSNPYALTGDHKNVCLTIQTLLYRPFYVCKDCAGEFLQPNTLYHGF